MRSVKSFIAAGAATLLSSVAFAADMADRAAPDVCAAARRRGFRRLVSARRYRLQQSARRSPRTTCSMPTTSLSSQRLGFNTAGIFGLGVGYRFNNWFRADVTGEYRGNSQFPRHRRHHVYRGVGVGTDTYHAHQVRVGRSRQRLCRSRHLVVHHAVHRRRRRWRAGRDHQLHRSGRRPTFGGGSGCRSLAVRRQRVEVEFRLGAACRSRLQGHRRTSRSNSPIAISTWATA